MSKLFQIDVNDSFRVRMERLAGRMTVELQQRIQNATKNLAEATYAKAQEMANNKLNSTAGEYRDALKYEQVAPGVYSITLDESAAHLEEGYGRFDMKPGLLKNAKKRSKKGFRYRTIPMRKDKSGSKGSMAADLKTLRAGFGDKGVTKGPDGQPLLGKIFNITQNDVGVWSLNPNQPGVQPATQRFAAPAPSKHLVGVTKYQYAKKMRNGQTRVQSAFVTFRTVSENPLHAGKWIHPGFSGIHIFPELFRWAEAQTDKMLREILGQV